MLTSMGILNFIGSSVITVLSFMLYFWAVLIAYNIVSAVFGLSVLRRVYIRALRETYSLFGFRGSSSRRKSVRFLDEVNHEGGNNIPRCKSLRQFKGEFRLSDACDYVHDGIEPRYKAVLSTIQEILTQDAILLQKSHFCSGERVVDASVTRPFHLLRRVWPARLKVLVEDDVTKCFTTEEIEEWNFLNRTRFQTNLGLVMELLLGVSIVFRLSIFLLIRLPIGIASLLWLVATMTVLSVLGLFVPEANWRKRLERYCSMVCSRLVAAALTAVVNVRHKENRAKLGSVCVANHTTPIDIIMLAVDNSFTLVGQKHGGILGIVQNACSLAQQHIWFERKISSDRKMVSNRLKEHVQNPTNNPILIFPEGTCINNTSVFMFKKGCFELGATIYPVVIKYHREFADPYWNSQEQSMLTYLVMIMTSWAIVCDVDYLEPTSLLPGETAIEFAQRVKADICRRGGLVDLPWDGMIKRPGNEGYLEKAMEEERKAYLMVLEFEKYKCNSTSVEDTDDSDDGGGLIMGQNQHSHED